MKVGTGFGTTKPLLAVIKLGLFTTLGNKGFADDIRTTLHLHSPSLYEFPGFLAAMGFLKHEGIYDDA